VLCAGGNDPNAPGPTTTANRSNSTSRPTFFNPDGSPSARPTITGISRDDGPDDVLAYGREFFIHTPNAGGIAKVALMRPGAMTHHTDTEQRYVAIDFIAEPGNGRLRALGVDDATIAPPGWYMLWITDTNNRPVPRARFVRLSRALFYIITDRSTFSKDEIARPRSRPRSRIRSTSSWMASCRGSWGSMRDAFQPPPSIVTPTITFTDAGGTVIPQLSAVVRELLVEIPSVPAGIRQRFVLRYAVDVRGTAPFFQSDGTTPIENRVIRIRAVRGDHVGVGTVRLTHQPNPYTFDGPKPWLSVDLRVFKVRDGDSRFGQAPLKPDAGRRGRVHPGCAGLFRAAPASARAQFESLPTEAEASQLDIAESRDGRRVYNFAIAQLRYRGRTLDAHDVRVFFRLFTTAATGWSSGPRRTPRCRTSTGTRSRCSVTRADCWATIPFFAEQRVNPGDPLTLQRDLFNTQTIVHNPSGAETTWYFGCWLDFNRAPGTLSAERQRRRAFYGPLASLQQLIRGAISAWSPSCSSGPIRRRFSRRWQQRQFAQRNLAILETDNPGGPATRTVQHTLRDQAVDDRRHRRALDQPRQPRQPGGRRRAARIHPRASGRADDPLGQPARETEVTVYLPSIPAKKSCRWPCSATRGAARTGRRAHDPLPRRGRERDLHPASGNRSTTIPGLVTMVLPTGIRRDNRFHVVVHQAAGVTRAIMGTFEIAIHVGKAALLLDEEKRTLSVMRHIALAIPPDDRWHRSSRATCTT
jgi:hypothetical protein